MEDAELLLRIRQHDDDAFEELVRRHQLQVRWKILQATSDSSSVDDIAQEVFLDLLCAIRNPAGAPIGSVPSWLRSVAHNKAIDTVRRSIRRRANQARHVQQLRAIPATRETEPAGPDNAGDEELTALQRCLGMLQPHHRELVDEFYGQGKSSELIATRLGKGAAGIRLMLTRIRRALAKCIRKDLQKSPP